MTPRRLIALLLRSLADLIDHPAKTRFLTVGDQRYAMRDDLPFIIKVE